MLAIRLRRQGRKNHAHYRMIVQDSRRHPTNGKVVAYLGNYDPYTKQVQLDADSAKKFLNSGAQPSPRAAKLLKESGVKLPKWVEIPKKAKKTAKNPEKLRKNQPKDAAPAPVETPAAEAPAEETAATEETPTEQTAAEAPAEEAAAEETAAKAAPAEPTSDKAPAEESKEEKA
jgi:small subunit ribosomal protein S16